MFSSDLKEEDWEHLMDTFILFVFLFSTTGNWKEKTESPAQIYKPQERKHLLHTESLKNW